MDQTYFSYFQQFFSILWTFLLSPVPVLGLPWITLFGGSLFIGVIMTSLNHILGFSANASFADNIRADNITDRNDAKYEARYQRSQRDQDNRWKEHYNKK